ncbi:unnamed protein product [Paramecium primaurelia]|uniref:Uncharacterized protein n=1 Tax=Paramecium primaurelia TaxID=5886 RepID=A0A8S1MPF4_PARPR|nr:unnamed protein product [Paramecium primaurelia]
MLAKDKQWQYRKIQAVMSKWINEADILIEMIICNFPSSIEVQKNRTSYLFECPLNNTIPQFMRECDFKGPLICIIQLNLALLNLQGVFQQISQSYQEQILKKVDFFFWQNIFRYCKKKLFKQNTDDIQLSIIHIRCFLWLYFMIRMLSYQGGVQKNNYLIYIGSPRILSNQINELFSFTINKSAQCLKRLFQSDQLTNCKSEKTRVLTLAGCGELHLDICLNYLVNDFAKFKQFDLIQFYLIKKLFKQHKMLSLLLNLSIISYKICLC